MVSEKRGNGPKNAGVLLSCFSERISKLPEQLQLIFFEDLETAIENRLKVLEAAR
ncbi:MAG: hypothetical protein NWE94_06970 [Candidatus Bathyarchaeota archaeon]|nr:hypothetical protein [Candidatus Bathyarchaeota archaeon]